MTEANAATMDQLKLDLEQMERMVMASQASLADYGRRLVQRDELIECLRDALTQSVRLQSHYAALLNIYDDGERMTFATAEAWINRLAECRKKGIGT